MCLSYSFSLILPMLINYEHRSFSLIDHELLRGRHHVFISVLPPPLLCLVGGLALHRIGVQRIVVKMEFTLVS